MLDELRSMWETFFKLSVTERSFLLDGLAICLFASFCFTLPKLFPKLWSRLNRPFGDNKQDSKQSDN
jgi:hypothetical protein